MRVLYLNNEIQPNNFHYRLTQMCKRLKIQRKHIFGKMKIVNLRGSAVSMKNLASTLAKVMLNFKPELVIVDPLYKLFPENTDENAAGDMADLMRLFDNFIQEFECAILIVHHDPKSPNTKTINRGAGSGILGRDCDAAIYIDPHNVERDEAVVVETISRNYPRRAAFCARFSNGRFELAKDLSALKETLGRKGARGLKRPSVAAITKEIAGWFTDGEPKPKTWVESEIRKKWGLSDHPIREVFSNLIESHSFSKTQSAPNRPTLIVPPKHTKPKKLPLRRVSMP